MAQAIKISEFGGPEVMKWESVDVGTPGKGEALVRHTAIGINFIDTYHRTGLYPLELPAILGMEAAGVIEELGEGVDDFKKGDRVAYATGPAGAYAEERLYPAEKLVKIPEGVSDEVAASIMLKGMTAEYLFYRTFSVQKGQTLLFHAAVGGVGLLACQWAKLLGATVIGTVGSEEKAQLAKANGCDHVILYREESIVDRVMEITEGRGVEVVYDGVGKDTFNASVEVLKNRGMLVSFGQASGAIPEQDLKLFAPKSLYFTRPNLFVYTETREELLLSAGRLFDVISNGVVKSAVNHRYPLKDAAEAHRALQARETTGSIVLIP